MPCFLFASAKAVYIPSRSSSDQTSGTESAFWAALSVAARATQSPENIILLSAFWASLSAILSHAWIRSLTVLGDPRDILSITKVPVVVLDCVYSPSSHVFLVLLD